MVPISGGTEGWHQGPVLEKDLILLNVIHADLLECNPRMKNNELEMRMTGFDGFQLIM